MPNPESQATDYRCPGSDYPVSRAVHLGRLARFYPGCRQCPHRHDTCTLSPRQVKQWTEVESHGESRPVFHDEETGATYFSDVRPATVRDIAAALGVHLQRRKTSAASPVVIAGDGRPLTAEMVAAVSEGLRWSGCDVVDIGPATSACLVFAMDHLRASGGLRVASPPRQPHVVALKFWDGDPDQTGTDVSVDILEQCCQTTPQRPTRVYGSLRRFQADGPYLACLAPGYHALRPLRIVLDCACDPLPRYLQRLIQPLACQIIPRHATCNELGRQVLADQAHFAASIDNDGETCRFLDEQGRQVPAEQLCLLVARHLLAEHPKSVVVLEAGMPSATASHIEALGGRVVRSDARPNAIVAAVRQHRAIFGAGPSGRFWHVCGGAVLPDALMTLTWLLVILSRSDRRFSEVLDDEALAE